MANVTLIGGSGFIETGAIAALASAGHTVTVVDRERPSHAVEGQIDRWIKTDLASEHVDLPEGPVLLMIGGSEIRRLHSWMPLREFCLPLARLAPQLVGRDVILLSSIDVYGDQPGPLNEALPLCLPQPDEIIEALCATLIEVAGTPAEDSALQAMREAFAAYDPSGRWTYAFAKRAQELILQRVVEVDRLHVLRLSNVYGVGQHRVIKQLVGRALAGKPLSVTDTIRSFVPVEHVSEILHLILGGTVPAGIYNVGGVWLELPKLGRLVLDELRAEGAMVVVPPPADDLPRIVDDDKLRSVGAILHDGEMRLRHFIREAAVTLLPVEPPIAVVIPPRPFDPALVARRSHIALQTGELKFGNRWTNRLRDELTQRLMLPEGQTLLLTNSGTSALRMAIVALSRAVEEGDVAILPSFTFPATAEVLVQLGYKLRFCDVDPDGWTMDPAALDVALAKGRCKIVVAVDALGNPCDYDALNAVCARWDVPLVADSAPALGALHKGRPVGSQAAAHAFSMSFAKVVNAGGAGGALVIPANREAMLSTGANWWRSSQMTELAAIVALDQVERLDLLAQRRAAVAEAYAMLETAALPIVPQRTTPDCRHAWVHWAARFPALDQATLGAELASLGIGNKPYYTPALHDMPWNGRAESAGALPITERLVREVIALPMSSEIDGSRAEQISFAVARLMEAKAALRGDKASSHKEIGGGEHAAVPVNTTLAQMP